MGKEINTLHISVVGRANVGKSRLMDCIFSQEECGDKPTNTNKTKSEIKSFKLLPNGSTASIDFIVLEKKLGALSKVYVETLKAVLNADFSIIVLDAREQLFNVEAEIISFHLKNHAPFLVAVNKIEFGTNPQLLVELDALEVTYFELSCKENAGIDGFRKKLIHMLPSEKQT